MDAIFIGAILLFVAVSGAFAAGCAKLEGQ